VGAGWKEGIAYSLPKGVFRVNVVENAGSLALTLAGPVVVADRAFPLVSRLPRSGTSDNEVKVSVDPKTSLLTKVEVTSTGDVGTLVQNLATAVVTLQAGTETGGTTIFSKSYDIDDLTTSAATDVNAFLVEYYGVKCGSLSKAELPFAKLLKPEDTAADTRSLAIACRRMSVAGVAAATSGMQAAGAGGLVSITVQTLPEASTGEPPVSDRWAPTVLPANLPLGSACAKGVCYRPMTTRTVTLKVRGAFEQRDVFLVPDMNRTMFVGLPQGVFAQQKYTLTFSDGVLTEYGQNTKSELVGLSTLPVAVLTAILKAPADALGLRTANLKAQGDYLSQLAELQTAKASIAATCRLEPNSCPLTALKIIGTSITDKTQQSGGQATNANTVTSTSTDTPAKSPWLTNDSETRQ